jgi:DNA-binding SARP family transcriptional activator
VPAPRITIAILGQWEFRVDGRMMPRPSTLKAQSLLAYAIVNSNTAHSREKLATLFWPEADEDRAQRSLRTALWSVRRLLTTADSRLGDALIASRFDVRWSPRVAVEIDVEQFERAHAQWRQARSCDAPGALAALQTAIALYRGPFLDGLYDDWCLDERYRLEEQYLGLVEASVHELEVAGQIREAVAHAQRLLVIDPLKEEVHRTIIRLLGTLGDRSGLMRQYQRCKEILARELDEPPSVETEAALANALKMVQTGSSKPPVLPVADDAPAPHDARETRRQPNTAEVAGSQGRRDPVMPARSSDDNLPLVGREVQWQTLIDRLAHAEAGQGHTILIAGEAGSGKTRLLEEVTARARWRSMRVLWGTCYDYERVLPYQPFTEALRNSLRPATNPTSDGEARPHASAGSAVSDLGTLAALPLVWQQALLLLLPDWADRLAEKASAIQGPSQDQAHLFEGIGRYLQALADRQPLVLVIDDLQWAAPSTLQLFHYIARTAWRHAILLIGSYRPEDLAPVMHAPAEGAGSVPSLAGLQRSLGKDGVLDTVTLGRLTGDDVTRLVRDLPDFSSGHYPLQESPGDRSSIGALAERLFEFTEGNPLFLAAVLQALRDDGLLGPTTTHAKWQLPTRIRDLLQERIERVSPLARDAVKVAAVAGREFDMAVLQRAWGKDEEETLLALDDMLANRLVKEVSSRGARDFAFSHHLLREATYEGLSQPVRARTHRRVAEAMQEIYTPRTVSAELAFHFEQAGLLDQAIVHARHAGARAASSFANQDADHHYSQALLILVRLKDGYDNGRQYDEQRFDLIAARLSVRQRIGMPEQEMRDVAEMLVLALRLQDARREAAALLERSALHARAGRYAEAAVDARKAVERVRSLNGDIADPGGGESLLLARASASLGVAYFHQDGYEKAIEAYRQSLAIYGEFRTNGAALSDDARLETGRGEADVLNQMGRVYQQLGDYAEARRHHARALAISQAGHDSNGEASALNSLGGVSWFAGDLDGAQRYFEDGLDIERRIGYRHGEGTQLRNLGLVFWRRRDFERALACLRDALAIFEDLQEPGKILECYQGLGDIRYLVGPLEDAWTAYQLALAIARSMDSDQKVAQSLFGCARFWRITEQFAAAVDQIAEARTLCQSIGWPRGIAWCNREEGLARLDLGDVAEACTLLRAAFDGFLALGERGFAAAAQAELAGAYLARQEPETARALAEQAAAAIGVDPYGSDQPQAIYFILYRTRLALDDRPGARQALAAAAAEIEEQAGRLSDPELRDSFRRNVPINHAIAAEPDASP